MPLQSDDDDDDDFDMAISRYTRDVCITRAEYGIHDGIILWLLHLIWLSLSLSYNLTYRYIDIIYLVNKRPKIVVSGLNARGAQRQLYYIML